MSRFIIILLLAIISGSNKLAAQIDSAQFLLRNFENGYVYYKDGRTFNVPLNYSLLIKKFLFQDQHDNNNIKEFSEPEMVATIKIGERIFLPTKDGATEVLQKDPPIFVQYRGALKWEGKQVGYGGRSETSAVDSYSSFQSGNTTHKLETEKLILSRIDKIFRIERNGKQFRFLNEKQFLKAFPDHKEELKKYADDNKTDFNEIEDVLQIYNHAVTLSGFPLYISTGLSTLTFAFGLIQDDFTHTHIVRCDLHIFVSLDIFQSIFQTEYDRRSQ